MREVGKTLSVCAVRIPSAAPLVKRARGRDCFMQVSAGAGRAHSA